MLHIYLYVHVFHINIPAQFFFFFKLIYIYILVLPCLLYSYSDNNSNSSFFKHLLHTVLHFQVFQIYIASQMLAFQSYILHIFVFPFLLCLHIRSTVCFKNLCFASFCIDMSFIFTYWLKCVFKLMIHIFLSFHVFYQCQKSHPMHIWYWYNWKQLTQLAQLM